MKPGVSVSTINPSKSKTIAASVILVVVSVAPEKWRLEVLVGGSPVILRIPGGAPNQQAARFSALKADFEKLRIGKESLQLHDSILRAIGPMNHIEHDVPAKVASDRSLCGLSGISRSHEFADQSDSILAG